MITYSDLAVSDNEVVDADFFNRRYNLIVSAVAEAMAAAQLYGTVSTQLLQLGLDRVDGVLGPLLIRLSSAAELGFLIAQSSTLQTLDVGNQGDFIIADDAQKALFTPTPWLTVIDNTDDQNYAVLQLINWDGVTGILQTTVMYVHGGATISSEDWTIACASAVLPAMADMLAQAQTASSDAQAANAGVQSALDDLQAAIAAIQEGPVSSVAGHTGAVTLAMSDIIGLVSALSGKLTTSGNLGDVPNATTARANLGLGSAALQPTSAFVQSSQNLNDIASLSQTRLNLGAAASAIQINTATGLSGGGDLTANRTISYNIPALTVKATPIAANDYIIIYDAAGAATKRSSVGAVVAAGASVATDADIRAATGSGYIPASAIASASVLVALTDAAPVAVNWNAGVNFSLTVTANRQIGNPTNGKPGTTRTILVQGNDATDRTITFGNEYLGSIPTVSDCDNGRWYLLTIFCVTASHFVVQSVKAKGT